jgi:hypothetical protein
LSEGQQLAPTGVAPAATRENTVIKKFTGGSVALTALFWAGEAFAICGLPLPSSPPCPGGSSVPEIDGTAGMMALALVASAVALFYNRGRK